MCYHRFVSVISVHYISIMRHVTLSNIVHVLYLKSKSLCWCKPSTSIPDLYPAYTICVSKYAVNGRYVMHQHIASDMCYHRFILVISVHYISIMQHITLSNIVHVLCLKSNSLCWYKPSTAIPDLYPVYTICVSKYAINGWYVMHQHIASIMSISLYNLASLMPWLCALPYPIDTYIRHCYLMLYYHL